MAVIYTMSFLIMIVTEIDNPEFRCGRMLYILMRHLVSCWEGLEIQSISDSLFSDKQFSGSIETCYDDTNTWTHFNRSSHRRCSLKTAVLKNFAIFTGKRLCWSFFNKVVGQKARNFIKKRLQHRCFLWILRKF